jgi:hypothetical protein
MRLSEFLAVGVHEFSHFYDLYVLVRKNGIDISDYFYDIAWEDTRIIKASLNQRDFVSGYAMTNKYEDFAESYTYYVFHNSDFFKRSRESNILMQKYDFFSKYIFPNNEFLDGLLYSASEPKNYYRDVTKISFSLENFLQYLKN